MSTPPQTQDAPLNPVASAVLASRDADVVATHVGRCCVRRMRLR